MRLKEIYTKHFPKKGYTALTVWPFVFVRTDMKKFFTKKAKRHEKTHALQQIEMLVVGLLLTWLMYEMGFGWYSVSGLFVFFEVYILEWIMKIPFCKNDTDVAYMSISFEQEAYGFQDIEDYNEKRRHFAWLKYLFTTKPKEK